jgi:hypothetical protein
VAFSLFALRSLAQTPATRITTEISNSACIAIAGSRSPRARAENDAGRVPPGNKLEGINIVFSRSAAQEADLQALIAAQQDPASPLYHKWLTVDEFAARFGVADSDITKVEAWLEQQGFSVDGVSRSKNRITFSGTVGQVAAAFGAELHYYQVNGEPNFAPAGNISVPAALSSLVQTVSNLSTFRPRPHVRFKGLQPAFTSSQTGNHFLTPKDVATIYDVNPAYNAGYDGTGQSIAIVGQSAIVLSDIEHFQSAAGFTVRDPTQILVPNSGTSTIFSGDEAESDLDLEYSSTIAPGATIYFVYVGNNQNFSVFDSISYAVDHQTAPVISDSYGLCETALSSSEYSSLNDILAQAATQGQSVIAPSGDDGSTDCYGTGGLSTGQQQALAVDFPASSQYVTGMGGSEFPAADVDASNTTYWAPASGSDIISSARSYIPEQVWNDDDPAFGLSAGGGGVSTMTARPSWQTGVPGIPAGSFRLVPDISLASSPNNAGYLYCSSDSSTGITGSCSNGFRDSNNQNLTVAGGTSFPVPIFAGMVAIINQKLNSTGLGVVNSTLYTLAANSTTYASAFHDITNGGNQCTAGSTYCSSAGTSEYPATTGYDAASGLGSIDFYNLLTAWPTTTASFTVDGSAAVATAGGSGVSTITLTPARGFTGQVQVTCPAATLPPGVTCSPNPLNIDVTSSSQATGQLTLSVTAPSAPGTTAEIRPARRPEYASLERLPASKNGWWKLSAGSGLAAILLFILPARRYRATTLGLWLICVLSFIIGCGGGGGVVGTTAAMPSFSPGAGTYGSAQSVTITSTTNGATICYTIDGTTPTATSPGTCSTGTTLANGGAVTVSISEILEAIATESGFSNSGVASATYAIGPVATTTRITAPQTKVAQNAPLSFNIAVTATSSGTAAGNGMVGLFDGTTQLGAAVRAVNGVADFNNITSLSVGTHAISAHYLGDSSTLASQSGAVNVTVTGTTTVRISTNPASSNSNPTISLTIS